MKKLSAAIFFLLTTLLCAFPNIKTLPTEERPSQWVQFDLGSTLNRGIKRNQPFCSAEYNFDWQPFQATAGFKTDARIIDFTLRGSYLPFAFYRERGAWRLGAATSYHLQRNSNSFFEHDILEEFEARWISKRGLTVSMRAGYSWRITTYDALKNFFITDADPVIRVEIDKVWASGAELFAALGSYSLYRYPLFFCPQWTFGAAWNIKQSFRLGAAVELSMTDFFASVALANQIVVKCNARFMF